jgi:CHASE3 domain sensor protein
MMPILEKVFACLVLLLFAVFFVFIVLFFWDIAKRHYLDAE